MLSRAFRISSPIRWKFIRSDNASKEKASTNASLSLKFSPKMVLSRLEVFERRVKHLLIEWGGELNFRHHDGQGGVDRLDHQTVGQRHGRKSSLVRGRVLATSAIVLSTSSLVPTTGSGSRLEASGQELPCCSIMLRGLDRQGERYGNARVHHQGQAVANMPSAKFANARLRVLHARFVVGESFEIINDGLRPISSKRSAARFPSACVGSITTNPPSGSRKTGSAFVTVRAGSRAQLEVAESCEVIGAVLGCPNAGGGRNGESRRSP